MACLECICGSQPKLESVILSKDVQTMQKLVRGVRSPGLAGALLLAAQLGDPNCRTESGSRPLHEAVRAGNAGVLCRLIAAGAALDEKNAEEQTPMDLATALGDKQIINVLFREVSRKKTNQFVEGISLLTKVSLFATMHPAEYPKLATAFVSRTYQPGDVVIRQGEPGDELFIIQSGTAQVLIQGPGDERPSKVNILGPGDYFGEAALLNQTPRNATIEATDMLEVKALSRKDFQVLDLRNLLHFTKRKAVHQVDEEVRRMRSDQVAKTPEQCALVRSAMLANPNLAPLLEHLSAKDLDDIVEHAFRMEVQRSVEVVKQGQLKADLFYIVEEGQLEVTKNGEQVFKYGPGGSFGELAMLFRAPRAATVKAVTRATLWVLHRQDLRMLMQARVKKKLQVYASLLARLESMRSVSSEDRVRLADALVEAAFTEGEYIIKQGEEGQTFFILYEGQVSVEVNGKEVTKYSGDPTNGSFESFGERALEMDEPRAASIKVLSKKAVVLALDREVYLTVQGTSIKPASWSNGNLVEYRKDQLEPIGLLGTGGFGVVSLVKCHVTGHTFALKALSKGHIVAQKQELSVMNEKGILRMTHSPFLVRLAATFNGDEHLYFLLEPAMGGELYTTYQRKSFHGSATHGRFYAACVLRAFEHLHARQIIYRDLKPENLLLDSKGYCKVTDFGLAKFAIGHAFTTCGTPDYFCPEMVLGSGHTSAVDWWTLGVLVFEFMTADTPFSAQDPLHVFRKVTRGIEAAKFPAGPEHASWTALVKALCKHEPSERLPMRKGCAGVEEHEWFREASFDWAALDARTMPAPYVPKVKSPQDLGNFEAHIEDAPPDLPYHGSETGWDKNFEDTLGPATFD